MARSELSAQASSVDSVTDVDDSKALQQFRRDFFGFNVGGETMPPAYVFQLRRLVGSAQATLGIRLSETERTAYWLDGRTLGHLACTGSTDADAAVSGWVLRLDDVGQIDIDVKIQRGRFEDDSGMSGRVLKIDGNMLLDASPGRLLPDKLAEIEVFIDRILAEYAGRPGSVSSG
jgi:hypothetical protein